MESIEFESRRQIGEGEKGDGEKRSVCSRCEWNAVERTNFNFEWWLDGVLIPEVKGLKKEKQHWCVRAYWEGYNNVLGNLLKLLGRYCETNNTTTHTRLENGPGI